MQRYICIHGHFYQPPRENPWLQEIEVQDSAHPFHDWNERICAECYAPNSVARILDDHGRIIRLMNNYARISFNFGPTLLSWLEEKAPDVYRRVLEADKGSQKRFGGHGSALAQAYNHMIIPLANHADQVTQVVWGLADFQHRFGRHPEGMWLPETAVDLPSLCVLTEHGIRFTILAPYQAARWRPLGTTEWNDVLGGRIDPTRPYLCRLPNNRTITLFFYDGPISQGVAFERLLAGGEKLVQRLASGFNEGRDWPQLLHIATDGETYGHHHKHGDMALAYALHMLEAQHIARLTNYAEYLEKHPPTCEVEIVEKTAWSSSNALERWEGPGGGHSGRHPHWHQRWRAPLRASLDWLRDTLTPLYQKQAAELVRDPWTARNGYIHVLLQRHSPESWLQFLHDHARRELSSAEQVRLRQLLELQRHAMLMYTSCGWFFDEISGLESSQVLMYAGRAVQLGEELFGQPLEEPFLERLEHAPSNLKEFKNGRGVYERFVRPARLDWDRIAAHYAISSLFETYTPRTRIFCYTVQRHDHQNLEAGKIRLVVGQARFTSDLTGEEATSCYGAIHFGDHNVSCGVKPSASEEDYQQLSRDLNEAFARVDAPQIVRLLDRYFGESSWSLASLFRDEQRKILKVVTRAQLTEVTSTYTRLYEQQLPLMRFLKHLGVPLPRSFLAAAEYLFNTDLRWAFADDDPNFEYIRQLLHDAESWGVTLDAGQHSYKFSRMLARTAERWRDNPEQADVLTNLRNGVELARGLPFEVDLWAVQNIWFELRHAVWSSFEHRAEEGDEDARVWLEQFIALGEQVHILVDERKKKMAALTRLPTVAELVRQAIAQRHIPVATYRLQLHRGFPFAEAQKLIPYLAQLGISDVYLSPILQARPGSMHGYDICDHSRINPELGGAAGYNALAVELHRHKMSAVLDIVSNHMCVAHPSCVWWMDVLENGISSRYARYFDIDWHPINPDLNDKVLLPLLGEQYGLVLESSQLRLSFEEGAFHLNYWDHQLPIAPRTTSKILGYRLPALVQKLGAEHPAVTELQSILTALNNLPPRTELPPERIEERYREKTIIQRRLRELLAASPDVRAAIDESLRAYNGQVGRPGSFDLLDALIEEQSYRPAFWRVSMEEINYRRFFDINDLGAIRVEDPEVFQATHLVVLQLLAEGKAGGLRIDHPDGLRDPTTYFRQLQEQFLLAQIRRQLQGRRLPTNLETQVTEQLTTLHAAEGTGAWPLYVVAEKILTENEPLPRNWAVAGTTGYDFLNSVGGLFVERRNQAAFDRIYQQFLGHPVDFATLISSSKKLIMLVGMASEINSLSHQLDRIAERNRHYRDFTLNNLTFAIREVIASLPVYRTYLVPGEPVALRDRAFVENAVEEAKQRNPRTAESVFDFIRDTALLLNVDRFREEDRPRLIDWALRFQQLTGPIMAKGVEDTAFYLYNRLVALNEVGGHPEVFGLTLDDFHRHNQERLAHWPHAMLASTTHDTKRSEDVRARQHVLSEMPEEWERALHRWQEFNSLHVVQVDGQSAPDPNDQYLLYQTLVGAWPPEPVSREEFGRFRQRIIEYMQKATKEAKARTSWINPNEEYDAALRAFITEALPDDPTQPFRADLETFQRHVAHFGYLNSLSQLVLRLTSPGIPDIYQGTELWDFSLVDPDNRRPVDFGRRQKMLAEFQQLCAGPEATWQARVQGWQRQLADGHLKLYVLWRLLTFRREHPQLFAAGTYLPLLVEGDRSEHVCGFVRIQGEQTLLVAVPRLVRTLVGGKTILPLGAEVWGDSRLRLPEGCPQGPWRNLFTGTSLPLAAEMPLASVFEHFPLAALVRTVEGDGMSGS